MSISYEPLFHILSIVIHMNRKKFFQKLGLSTGAIMAVYCMGGLSGCAQDQTVPTPNSNVDFNLDLSSQENAVLNQTGGFVIAHKVVIARTAVDTFAAVTQICSHEGQQQVTFQASSEEFYCTAHGARYDTKGHGLNSNGSRGLTTYQTVLQGNMLHVFA